MIKTETPTARRIACMRSTRPAVDKSHWTEIGAASAHQDGKGFNVKLDYLPLLNGAEIVTVKKI